MWHCGQLVMITNAGLSQLLQLIQDKLLLLDFGKLGGGEGEGIR